MNLNDSSYASNSNYGWQNLSNRWRTAHCSVRRRYSRKVGLLKQATRLNDMLRQRVTDLLRHLPAGEFHGDGSASCRKSAPWKWKFRR